MTASRRSGRRRSPPRPGDGRSPRCWASVRRILRNGPPPIEVVRASGFVDPTLLIVVKWTLTTIVVPALVGVAKEEAKDRLTRLWKEVLLPAIRGKKEDAIN